MDTRFGEYVKAKRLEKDVNLRKLAEILGIVPAYMSDIEKGRRYPPDREKIYKIAEALSLTEDETNEMFDLAALAKENSISPDLPEYIMGSFLREQPTALTEYNEPLVRRLIEKVTVYEDKFIVEFKSGVTVDVDE